MKQNNLISSLKLGYARYPTECKRTIYNSIMIGPLGYKNKKSLLSSSILQKIYNRIIPNIDLNGNAAKPLVLIDTLVKIYRNTLYLQYHISGIK